MSGQNRDVRVRIRTEADNSGTRSAEESARILARELDRLEQQQRRQVQMQMRASREMAAEEARRAQAVVEANQRQAQAMESFGRKTLLASAAIVTGLGLAAKAAIDWESAWAGVTKTVDGDAEEMEALEQRLRRLATVLPATHEEIARVAEAAGALGVKTKDIASFTKTMIDLGETTNLTSDEAATSLAQFSNIMGIGADQAGELGAALVALGNDGASTEHEILEMGMRIAGAGRTAGVTAPQVLGLASALSSVGLEAEAGGTAISRVLTRIDSDVRGGKTVVQDYARVAGVSAAEFSKRWREDAGGAVTLFIEGLGRMQAEGENTTAVLEALGFEDVRVSDTLRRASLAGDMLADSLKLGSDAFVENLALVEEANKRYATTESRLKIARNQINDAAIDIGGNLLPAVAGAADGVAALAAGFQSLPDGAKTFVTWLGAGAAGLTALVGGAAILIPKLHELRVTLDVLAGGQSRFGQAIGRTLAFLTGPWGIALAAAAVVTGVWLAKQGEAARRVDDLTASLDKQTAAVTDNSRATVYKTLLDNGVIEAAKRANFALGTVVDAALGSTEAYESLARQADATYERMGNVPDPTFVANSSKVLEGLRVSSKEVEEAQARMQDQIAAGATQTDAATQSVEMASEALDEFIKKVSDADAGFVDLAATYDAVIEKNKAFAEASAEATKSSEDSWEDFYDGVSVSAADYIAQLQAQVDAQSAWEQNVLDISARVRDGLTGDMKTAGEQMIDELLKLGPEGAAQVQLLHDMSDAEFAKVVELWSNKGTAAVSEFANKVQSYRQPPINVDANIGPALEKLEHLRRTIAGVTQGNANVIDVRYAAQAYLASKQENGSVLEFYRAGGVREQHVAQIAPAGAMRVWAEPETGGEAYIPLAPAKRVRSEAILEDVAARFGMYVGRYANGAVLPGSTQAAPTRATSPGGITIHGDVYTRDVDDFARTVLTKQRDAGVLASLASIAAGGGLS